MTSIGYDVCAIGNAIVDIVAEVSDEFLNEQEIFKGGMMLVSRERITALRRLVPSTRMIRAGGLACNVVASVSSFGGSAAYMGITARDEIGNIFRADMKKLGITFPTQASPRYDTITGLCLSLVSSDAQRSLCTYPGVSNEFSVKDIDLKIIKASKYIFLEAYMFDQLSTRRAIQYAAEMAQVAGNKIAMALCDPICVARNRKDVLALVQTQIHILFATDLELLALYEKLSLEEAICETMKTVRILVIMRAERGFIVFFGTEHYKTTMEPTLRIVDKSGNKAAFAAGFLYGISNQMGVSACTSLGALAANEVMSHYGARPECSLAELARAKGLLG